MSSSSSPSSPIASDSPTKLRTSSKPPSISDFLVGRQLGEGAFARVFHVRAKDTRKDFALKVMEKRFIIKEDKMAQVQMERKALSELSHPFIIHLFSSFHDKERLYLVLELCPGGELSRIIRNSVSGNRALEENLCKFYFAELVSAVQHLHTKNFLHRDLKPENVLISKSGHIKLTDFGTAKVLSPVGVRIII